MGGEKAVTTEKCVKSGEVTRELGILNDNLIELDKTVSILGDVLNPILSTETPGDPVNKDEELSNSSELADTINNKNVRLRLQIRCIRRIIDRVEL